jgi:hypothetical protein
MMKPRDDCNCDPAACFDPAHEKFWMPANWPLGRAPVRLEFDKLGGVHVTATVVLSRDWPDAWIPGHRGDLREVWSSCGGRAQPWQIEELLRDVRQQRDLEVFGGLGAATEALLDYYEAAA